MNDVAPNSRLNEIMRLIEEYGATIDPHGCDDASHLLPGIRAAIEAIISPVVTEEETA
jgi:hypothetical protein